ncbi:MAG TPA: vWA domain-containing protein [Gemmatimonadales bacterium]
MTSTDLRHLSLPIISAAVLFVACGSESTGPDDPPDSPNLGLAIAVRTDPATFQQTGEFVLELIPNTTQGQSLVAEPWDISNTVTKPSSVSPDLLSKNVTAPDTSPPSLALLVDNSSSMSTNDPESLRIAAATLLWETVLQERPKGQVSLLYFGVRDSPSPGFSATALLRNWTSDPADLAGALDTLSSGAGSQIYSSTLEVIRWIDSTTPEDARRVLLLLTDGQLNRETNTSLEVLEAARQAGVSIGTVALGPASDRSDDPDPEAVALLQELANGSGGLYSGAATPERLSSTLLSLTSPGSVGALHARFKLSPVPGAGSQVTGTVRLANESHGSVSGGWSFTAP